MDIQIITLLSGILSIVIIIVFFIMANKIGKVLSEVRNIRDLLILQAKTKGINYILCSKCKEDFFTDETEEAQCPKCNEINKISK